MKKPILLTSGLFVFVILFNWFFSELFDALTPFLFVYMYPILFVVVVAALVYAIVVLVKRFGVFRWKAAVPLIILLVMIGLALFFPFRKAKVLTEFVLYTPQRMAVVEQIASGELAAQSNRGVVLPLRYRHLSCDGEVYIETKTDDELVVGFWVFRGLMVNGHSMVYYLSNDTPAVFDRMHREDVYEVEKLGSNWYYLVVQ